MNRLYSAVQRAQEEQSKKLLERSQHIEEADIKATWKILSPNGDSAITKGELIERLSPFRHMDLKAANYLAGTSSMTEDKLMKLLLLPDGTPALPCNLDREAWKLLDPYGREQLPLEQLLQLLALLPGCDQLDAQDMNVVRCVLDLGPQDGTVTAKSWQQLGSWAPKLEELSPAQRRMLAARSAAGKAGAGTAGPGGAGPGGVGRSTTMAGGRKSPAPR